MADIRTLQNMIDRIADEFKTDDLLGTDAGRANIFNAIVDAIIYYQRESLFANDAIDQTITTIAGKDTYDVPENLVTLLELNIVVGGQRYEMWPRTVQEILDYKTQFVVVERGQPYEYCFYNTNTGNGQVIIWPAPDVDGYLLEFVMQARIPVPTVIESNFWTTVGEGMVRNRAKWLINTGITRDFQAAQADKLLEEMAYNNVLQESVQKQSTNTLTPSKF